MTNNYTLNSAQMCMLEWILATLDENKIESLVKEQLYFQKQCPEDCNETFTETQLKTAIDEMTAAVDTSDY